jgi:predicted  nucleic acid-binding Zn-ribbon protein
MATVTTTITVKDMQEFKDLFEENKTLKQKNKNLSDSLQVCLGFINKISGCFADAHVEMQEINQLNQDNL